MNKDFLCVLFFLTAMFLLIFCVSGAEVYEDPDMCFSLTQDGWIRDLINAYEIKASDANLYVFDAFSTLTFAAELGKVDFEISMDPAKPYDRALILFDGTTFKPASVETKKPVVIVMNAIIDPEKVDEDLYQQYASLKYSVIDDKQKMRQDILIWANEQGKKVPIDGIFWFIDLPKEYDQKDIARYGSVLNYLTRFVYEAKQSSLDFSRLLSSFETDENGAFKTRTTRQLTGRGYSIGLIADPSFVFLTITNTDAVLFRNNDSVFEYYEKVTRFF
ncbi:MAG: hypothetical protein IJI41_10575 [Anaerolineaceae bacterium]|nr:hypothetical protein [Anaerolineaceae bacterium]